MLSSGTSFNLVCFMSYSTPFSILPKLFLDHLPLVCFWLLLYSVIYLFILLFISCAPFPDCLVVNSSPPDIELISLFVSEWVLTISGG